MVTWGLADVVSDWRSASTGYGRTPGSLELISWSAQRHSSGHVELEGESAHPPPPRRASKSEGARLIPRHCSRRPGDFKLPAFGIRLGMAEPADERAPLVAGPPPRARASRAIVAAAFGLTVAAAWMQRPGRADGQASARGPHADGDGSRSAVSFLAATVAPSPFPTGLTFAPTGGSPTFRPTIALKSYASPTLSPSGGSAIPTASVPVPTAT